MRTLALSIIIGCLLVSTNSIGQPIKFENYTLTSNLTYVSIESMKNEKVVRVIKDSTRQASDEPTFGRINGIDFRNGTIEIKVLSRLLKTAPEYARGFIGVAFRIDAQNSTFECIYLRPTNGRAEDQYRRNHSIQYFSYPNYKFDKLRKEAEGHYETYADMGLNEWITMRIEVKGKQAKLFLNNQKQPALIVNDLKLGENISGAIGLWVDVGTEGFFKDLKIHKE